MFVPLFILCLLTFPALALAIHKNNRYLATGCVKPLSSFTFSLSQLVSILFNNGYFRIPTCKSVIN